MKKLITKSFFVVPFGVMVLTPFVALAATATSCDALSGVLKLLCQFHQILNALIPVIVALAVVYLVWGIVQYFIAGGEEAKKKGRDRIVYGIIGLAVIVSLWGLVALVVNTLGAGGVTVTPPSSGASSSCNLGPNPKFQDLLSYATCIINGSIIPLIFALATVAFVWGVVHYFILNADEEAKRSQGKQFMIWGIVALAVMLSVWGLVNILGTTFGINSSVLPHVTPPSSGSQ